MIDITGIDYLIAEKPYYGKFPFKVVIRGTRRNWRMSTSDQRAYNEFYNASRKMLAWVRANCKTEWRVRRESDWSFFFTDADSCKEFADQFHKSVRFITGPKNQHHQERMIESPKLLVRKSLFKKRYQYRVNVHSNALLGQMGESLRNWIAGQTYGEDLELNHNLLSWFKGDEKAYHRWGGKTIYFADESASIMLKLILGDNMTQIEKVITLDEFSKQEASNQEDA